MTLLLSLGIAVAAIALLLLLYLLLMLPFGAARRMRNASVHSSVTSPARLFAHRGLHDTAAEPPVAENSMTAFRRAIEAGYGIELDVRLSSDGVLVVFHDDTLTRVTGEEGRVDSRTAAELAALSLSGTTDGIPTLQEVLDEVRGRVPLLVEIKEDGMDHSVTEQTLQTLTYYPGEFLIESFNPFSLAMVKKRAPHVRRGLLCDHFTATPTLRRPRYHLLQLMLFNRLASPDFLALSVEHRRYLPFRLSALCRVPRYLWTVQRDEDVDALRREGYDGLIFEHCRPTISQNK